MAGLGAAINTGGVDAGQDGRRVRLRRRRRRGDRRRPRSPARRRSSPSTSTTASSSGPRTSAPRTRATRRTTDPVEYVKSVTGGFGADVCIEAIGNPTVYRQAFEARDLAGTVVLVGVPRPDGRHRAAVHRGVRPRRRAEVELVRRLPAVARLPDADRPLPPGPARPRPLRQRGDRARRRRGGVPQDGARRGAALRRRALRWPIELVTTDGIFALDGGEWEVTNNIWLVGDDREVVVVRRRPRPPADRRRRQRPPGAGDRADPRPQRPHQRRRAAARRRRRADLAARRRPHAVGRRVARRRSPTTTPRPARRSRSAATSSRVLHTPGHSPGCCCFHDAEHGVVFSGDTLFCGGPGATGRSYSDEPTILRSIRDTLLTLPGRDRRAHRPRRVDDDRRRASAGPRPRRRARHRLRPCDRVTTTLRRRTVSRCGRGPAARRRPGT